MGSPDRIGRRPSQNHSLLPIGQDKPSSRSFPFFCLSGGLRSLAFHPCGIPGLHQYSNLEGVSPSIGNVMTPEELHNIYRTEAEFWWYRGMRAITDALLKPHIAAGAGRGLD